MADIKTRVVAGALSLVLAVAVGACGDDDSPDDTSPNGSTTTAPIGS